MLTRIVRPLPYWAKLFLFILAFCAPTLLLYGAVRAALWESEQMHRINQYIVERGEAR